MNNSHGLLPSNFSLYAKCVSVLLENVINYINTHKDSPEVTIYTLFSENIDRWFNVHHVSNGDFWIPNRWWYNGLDGYLDLVAKSAEVKNLKLFRLFAVQTDKKHDLKNVVLRVNDTNNQIPHFASKQEIKKALENNVVFENVKLLSSVIPDDFQMSKYDEKMTSILLGETSDDPAPTNWVNALSFIENVFHSPRPPMNDEHSNDISIYPLGIHYRYFHKDNLEGRTYLSRDDCFIIEVKYQKTDTGGNPFGIIFNQNESHDTSGFKLMNSGEIQNAISEFKTIWSEGFNEYNEALKSSDKK